MAGKEWTIPQRVWTTSTGRPSPLRALLLLVVAALVVACAGTPAPVDVLRELDDGPLACRDEPRTREGAAGCGTVDGAVVATTHAGDGDLEVAAALLLGEGAGSRLVAGDGWLVITESEQLAAGVGEELDGTVVRRLEDVTGGCPDQAVDRQRLRDALGDPSWCT